VISISEKPKGLPRGRPKGIRSPAAIEYSRLRAKYPELPKKYAMRAAGYSPGTHTACVESGKVFKSLEKQKEEAIRDLRITVRDQLSPLVEIRDNKKEQASDRINAVKVANSMLPGYTEPEKKELSVRGMFVELKDVRTSDIAAFLEEQGG
jgi:hypothetical protein